MSELKLKHDEVVHCPTEDLANQVLQIAHDLGYKWLLDELYIEDNCYVIYKEDTCYNLNRGTFSSTEHYENHDYDDYSIIPAEEFIKRHETN